jgi:L-asparaginase/Glu-tRNA(Gln) amidotransferase subunit D
MTSETALVKLMWALAQHADVRTIMRADIAGECAGSGNSGTA